MRLLSLEQILQIHALITQETGGSGGLRDLGRLEAALATQTQHVFGQELYAGEIIKASALMRAVISDYPFIEGNKRTGVLACLTYLELNHVPVTFEKNELEDFAVSIAVGKLDVPVIASWIIAHRI